MSSDLLKQVQASTASGLSQLGRRQVQQALENYRAREKHYGRPTSRATLSRLQRELEATVRRQEA